MARRLLAKEVLSRSDRDPEFAPHLADAASIAGRAQGHKQELQEFALGNGRARSPRSSEVEERDGPLKR